MGRKLVLKSGAECDRMGLQSERGRLSCAEITSRSQGSRHMTAERNANDLRAAHGCPAKISNRSRFVSCIIGGIGRENTTDTAKT